MSILVSKEKSSLLLNHNYLRNPKLSLFQSAEAWDAGCKTTAARLLTAENELKSIADQYTKSHVAFEELQKN